MLRKFLFDILSSVAIGFLLFFSRSNAINFLSSKAKAEKNHVVPETNVSTLLRPLPEDDMGIFTQAIELLSSMQMSPSCVRLATLTLLDSCHRIDGSNSNAEALAEDVKSNYAAQLALCELVGAAAPVPSSCKALAFATQPGTHKVVSREIDKRQLDICLQSLESRPQWWTSYSNSRQNAVVMCQAARVDIDRDDLIKLHKSMIKINADASHTLAKAANGAQSVLNQLQSDFAIARRLFQEQLNRDLEASTAKTQTLLERLLKTMDSAMQTAMIKFTTATREVDSNTARISKTVQRANSDAIGLEKKVKRLFEQVAEGHSELTMAQARQRDQNRETAIELRTSLQNIKEAEINAILGVFHGIHEQLRTSNEIVSSLHARQVVLDRRLLDLDRSFANIQSRAENFQAAQTRQAEVQAQMQVDMQTSQEILDGLMTNIAGLKIVFETISLVLVPMTRFISIFGLAVAALIVMGLLYRRSISFVFYIIIFLVSLLCLKTFGFVMLPLPLMDLFNPYSFVSTKFLTISLAVAFLGAVAAACLSCHRIKMVFGLNQLDRTMDLVSIGEEMAERKLRKWHV